MSSGAVIRRCATHFDLARRMMDLAEVDLAESRWEQARTLVLRAIDELDRAMGIVWEHEHNVGRDEAKSGGSEPA